jgi:hypothetical protein
VVLLGTQRSPLGQAGRSLSVPQSFAPGLCLGYGDVIYSEVEAGDTLLLRGSDPTLPCPQLAEGQLPRFQRRRNGVSQKEIGCV